MFHGLRLFQGLEYLIILENTFCSDFQIMVMDLRTVSFDVPPQEILTRDSVTVAVDAVVYYRLFWMRMMHNDSKLIFFVSA